MIRHREKDRRERLLGEWSVKLLKSGQEKRRRALGSGPSEGTKLKV